MAPPSRRRPTSEGVTLPVSRTGDTDGSPDPSSAQLPGDARTVALPAGRALFRQGDRPDGLYLLTSGRLDVIEERDGGAPRRIGGLRPGHWVGELGLLTGDAHRFTVRARRDAVLRHLDLPRAKGLLESDASFREGLTRDAFRRVLSPPSEATPRVYAVLPATPGAPVRAVARALLASLGRRARCVAPEDVASLHGDSEALGRHLDQIEAESGTLLLLAEQPDSPWAQRVRRSADRVLAVARPDGRRHAPPATLDPDTTWLVVVHPDDGTPPRGTAGWRHTWSPRHVHHLRLGRPADADRLARHLTGRAIGLVLGGGAGRGLAHLGVVQALEEEGVPIDVVVGTSMGAIVGAQIAAGECAGAIEARMRRKWVGGKAIDLTLPVVSMARGTVFRKVLRDVLGERDILDLWQPFGCVSTSLRHARQVDHTLGSVVDAVYASSALPGLLPPVRADGDLRVDGAFVDNLPTALARQLGASRLIAVNVLPAIDPVFTRPLRRGTVRGWLRRYAPWSPERQPLLADIVMRAYFVPTVLQQDEVRAEVDLFLEPPVGGYSYFDTRAATFEAVVRAGYEEGLRGLRLLRAREPRAFEG